MGDVVQSWTPCALIICDAIYTAGLQYNQMEQYKIQQCSFVFERQERTPQQIWTFSVDIARTDKCMTSTDYIYHRPLLDIGTIFIFYICNKYNLHGIGICPARFRAYSNSSWFDSSSTGRRQLEKKCKYYQKCWCAFITIQSHDLQHNNNVKVCSTLFKSLLAQTCRMFWWRNPFQEITRLKLGREQRRKQALWICSWTAGAAASRSWDPNQKAALSVVVYLYKYKNKFSNCLFLFLPQWKGVGVVSEGPRADLHQHHVAAAPAQNAGHQDVGPGAADAGVMTSQMLNN